MLVVFVVMFVVVFMVGFFFFFMVVFGAPLLLLLLLLLWGGGEVGLWLVLVELFIVVAVVIDGREFPTDFASGLVPVVFAVVRVVQGPSGRDGPVSTFTLGWGHAWWRRFVFCK